MSDTPPSETEAQAEESTTRPSARLLPRVETDLADPAARRLTAMALAFWSSAVLAHLALGRPHVAAATLLPIVGLALARALIHRDANRERVLALALSSNVLGFFAIGALTGGMNAPTLLFLPTFAVAAGLLSPPRRALVWGAAALALVGVLGLLEQRRPRSRSRSTSWARPWARSSSGCARVA